MDRVVKLWKYPWLPQIVAIQSANCSWNRPVCFQVVNDENSLDVQSPRQAGVQFVENDLGLLQGRNESRTMLNMSKTLSQYRLGLAVLSLHQVRFVVVSQHSLAPLLIACQSMLLPLWILQWCQVGDQFLLQLTQAVCCGSGKVKYLPIWTYVRRTIHASLSGAITLAQLVCTYRHYARSHYQSSCICPFASTRFVGTWHSKWI